MNIGQYIAKISGRYKQGISSEHSYRGDLEVLIRELQPNVLVTNEPLNVTKCGNPDFVITKNSKDIQHYQKIIFSLVETHRIMEKIDRIEF